MTYAVFMRRASGEAIVFHDNNKLAVENWVEDANNTLKSVGIDTNNNVYYIKQVTDQELSRTKRYNRR